MRRRALLALAAAGLGATVLPPARAAEEPDAAAWAPYRPQFLADFTMLPYGQPAIPGVKFYDTSRAGCEDARLMVYNRVLQSIGHHGLCGAYMEVDMGAPVTRAGALFRLQPGGYGGAFALPLWAWSWGNDTDWGRGVPDSPAHIVITQQDWAFQVYRAGQLQHVAGGQFAAAWLPPNVPLRMEVRLDRAAGVAVLELPDGSRRVITDERIRPPARFAVFESWRMNADAMGWAEILMAWADTR